MPPVATILKPSSISRLIGFTIAGLSVSRTETNTHAVDRQRAPAPSCDLAKARPKLRVEAHDLAGRAHLRPEDDVDAGEAREREDRFLHRDVLALGSP